MDELEGGEFGSFENSRSSGNGAASNQLQISMENDVNLAQLKEREAALRKLENDIVDVNMIFKDLAVMVHDQGEIIDSIESNVEAVQIRVTEANTHLEAAKKHQVSFQLINAQLCNIEFFCFKQKARKRKFILICILASIVAFILLLIFLSIKLKN